VDVTTSQNRSRRAQRRGSKVSSFSLKVESFSHRGLVRERNEDALLVREDAGLFVVCDGIGGHRGGDVASSTCVDALGAALAQLQPLDRLPPGGNADERAAAFSAAVLVAHEAVNARARTTPGLGGMGTTCAALLFDRREVVVAHVGDSRAYVLRWYPEEHKHKLHPLTVDHTFREAFRLSGMREADIDDHPWAAALTQAVGCDQPHPTVTVSQIDVQVGDVFLVCSDGVHGFLPPTALAELLASPQPSVDLLEAVLRRGAPDNATAVVVRVDAV
jgi:serine/threonine protein phosphatase PrpC